MPKKTSRSKEKLAPMIPLSPKRIIEDSSYMKPQVIGIGNGKVKNVNKKTKTIDREASKTVVVNDFETVKVFKNKKPILAQHDNSNAMFRKMSNQTTTKEQNHHSARRLK